MTALHVARFFVTYSVVPFCLDSPRPGSATPGEVSSPRNNQSDSSAMYIARPLSKSTTNITSSARRTPDTSTRHRRISAGGSLTSSDDVHHCK